MENLINYTPEFNKDGTEKHIIKKGARYHVLSWDTNGRHCSEPNCEVNKKNPKPKLVPNANNPQDIENLLKPLGLKEEFYG